MLKPFILALQLLTRIPIPVEIEATDKQIGRSILFYPIVGLVIGAILYGLVLLLPEQTLLLNAAIVTALWIALTGGLHIDGLADSADAWVGGMGDRQRTLDIMKDPYCGPMGVTAIAVTILLKFTALYTLLQQGDLLPLLLIPVLGRAQILLLFLTTPYVREQGMGSSLATHLPRVAAWIVLGAILLAWLYLSVILVQTHAPAWIWLVPLLLLFFFFRRGITQRIGGTTGDTAGALVELGETTLLVTLAIYGALV